MGEIIAKIVAVICIAVIVFYLVAPTNYNEREIETTTESTTAAQVTNPINNDPNNVENPTEAPTDNSGETNANQQPTQQENPNNQEEQPVPTDTAGIVNYFNTALAKSSLKRTEYTRDLTLCSITILGDKSKDPKVKELVAASVDKAPASNPVSLNAANVASAQSSVSGNNVTLTIELNSHKSTTSLKDGDAGYVGLVEYDEIATLVNDIANAALGEDADLKSISEYNLSNGKYTAIIDKTSGKITSLKYSGTEGGTGKAAAIITVTVKLSIDITATYLP